MNPIDELRKIYNPRDLAYTHTMQAVIESILDLAAQVVELRERVERLDNLHSIMSCHMVPDIKPKFGPVLNNTKPAPTKDREPRTCRDCNRYDSGLCLKHNRRVSSEAHICNDFGPAKDTEDAVERSYKAHQAKIIEKAYMSIKSLLSSAFPENQEIRYAMQDKLHDILREFAAEVRKGAKQ